MVKLLDYAPYRCHIIVFVHTAVHNLLEGIVVHCFTNCARPIPLVDGFALYDDFFGSCVEKDILNDGWHVFELLFWLGLRPVGVHDFESMTKHLVYEIHSAELKHNLSTAEKMVQFCQELVPIHFLLGL